VKWISVNESLPEINARVIVCNQHGNIYINSIVVQNGLADSTWLSQIDNDYEEVTHWMPLPKPPKKLN